MESVYTQLANLADLGDNEAESNSVPRDHSSPASPHESSHLFPEADQRYPIRPPPRSYSSSPLPSTVFPFPNTSDHDSSLSSRGHKDGLGPHCDHPRVASGGSRVLFRLPDENGVLSNREKSSVQFASASTRQSSSSSRASSLLLPCDHTRYPLEKFRRLEGIVAYDCDLYEDKGPDPDDWLHAPDVDISLPNQGYALPWRAIANVGFLAVLLIVIVFLFVGLPIYTTTVRGWDM